MAMLAVSSTSKKITFIIYLLIFDIFFRSENSKNKLLLPSLFLSTQTLIAATSFGVVTVLCLS